MDNKIHKYELYTADFYASETSTIYKHIAYADTFEEAIEILVKKQDCHRSDPKEYNKIVNEIRSHSESELEGCEEICLYGGCSYYHEYLRKVPGYVDEDELVAKDVTLGEILKRELANVKDLKWEMKINTKDKEDFYLQVGGRNKVPVGNKYERIIGLPTHYVDWYYKVKSDAVIEYISEKTFPDVEWETVSVEEIDRRLKEFFLSRKIYNSVEEAVNSMPNELVLNLGSGGSITPYDKYGYQIVNISAYGTAGDKGVFAHIRRCGYGIQS